MEGKNRGLYSVMSTSIPSSVSTGSSISVQCTLSPATGEGDAMALDEPGTPMSGHKSLEGDEIVTGGEKPKGGKTGGESSSPLLLSFPLPFRSFVYLRSGV